ncbi:ribosome-associated translation inhibitor RaiA [Candidatus Kaiserbacteria bacterium]|nr:ribosome-associated translation inhibitor RaiA [Candidatus Kaiserbacteria bacterium]
MFPITHIKGTSMEVTDTLRSLIEQKFSTLEKHIGDETDITCDIELEKMTGSQSGDIYRAEANVRFHGKMYRAEATTDQIEKSIDEVKNEMDRELRRANNKVRTAIRKGGARLKNMLRFGK